MYKKIRLVNNSSIYEKQASWIKKLQILKKMFIPIDKQKMNKEYDIITETIDYNIYKQEDIHQPNEQEGVDCVQQ